MRLADKTALLFGAGQTPGTRIGNGRATAIAYAREGAYVLCVDRDLTSAEETASMIVDAGGRAEALRADVAVEADIAAAIGHCCEKQGRVDILHNNVGVSVAGGDAEVTEIDAEAFDRIMAINLRSMVLACKHALPKMRERRRGAIINIASTAAHEVYPWVTYKATKSAAIAFTKQVAIQNAEHNIRANVISPGLMDTPMAVDNRAKAWGKTIEEVTKMRNDRVPLGNKMGDAWDVANAALFLASDEAKFITGVELRVDGGAGCRIG